jgi:hypothetical protein
MAVVARAVPENNPVPGPAKGGYAAVIALEQVHPRTPPQ